MDKMEKQKELQKLFMESEAYRKQLEELMAQLQFIGGRKQEIDSTIEAIDSLADVKSGSEILVPVGLDVFIRAEIKDTDNFIVGVGAGVSVEKKPVDAKKIMHIKADKLAETEKNIQQALSEVNSKLVLLDSESKKLMAQIQG